MGVVSIGTIRKVEREVLRRRYGNKELAKAYRRNSFRIASNYIPNKRMLTCKGRAILNGLIVIAAAVVLMALIK